jgi:hypothetical protein
VLIFFVSQILIDFFKIFLEQLYRHSLFEEKLINHLVKIALLAQSIFIKSQILIDFKSYLIG